MVKSKRNINAFQKAMLSNTKVIGNSSDEAETGDASVGQIKIDEDLLMEYEKLAKKMNLKTDELIEIALQHFLNLEDFWLKSE